MKIYPVLNIPPTVKEWMLNRPGTFSQQLLSLLEKEPDYPCPSQKPVKLWTIRKLKNASILHCVDTAGYSDMTPPHHIFKLPNKECKKTVLLEYPFPPMEEVIVTTHREDLRVISIFIFRKDYSLDIVAAVHTLDKVRKNLLPKENVYLPRFVICHDQFRQIYYLSKVYFPKIKILTFKENLFQIEDNLP